MTESQRIIRSMRNVKHDSWSNISQHLSVIEKLSLVRALPFVKRQWLDIDFRRKLVEYCTDQFFNGVKADAEMFFNFVESFPQIAISGSIILKILTGDADWECNDVDIYTPFKFTGKHPRFSPFQTLLVHQYPYPREDRSINPLVPTTQTHTPEYLVLNKYLHSLQIYRHIFAQEAPLQVMSLKDGVGVREAISQFDFKFNRSYWSPGEGLVIMEPESILKRQCNVNPLVYTLYQTCPDFIVEKLFREGGDEYERAVHMMNPRYIRENFRVDNAQKSNERIRKYRKRGYRIFVDQIEVTEDVISTVRQLDIPMKQFNNVVSFWNNIRKQDILKIAYNAIH